VQLVMVYDRLVLMAIGMDADAGGGGGGGGDDGPWLAQSDRPNAAMVPADPVPAAAASSLPRPCRVRVE
jgi:hypothetical protein